jgi:hypothetical protein
VLSFSVLSFHNSAIHLSVINENCPACFEEPKERARIKKLLSREESLYPNLYDHIRRALIPVMHDDSTAIMRSYLEETIAKSVKVPTKGQKNGGGAAPPNDATQNGSSSTASNELMAKSLITSTHEASLEAATEEQLIAELARRRAAKFQLSGAMKRLTPGDIDDPTGQVCSLNGDDGSIPCRELME